MTSDIRKIAIVGSGGSGKSWLATRLHEATGLPLFHLDKELWQPGWVMPPREEVAARQQEIVQGERWIVDGNYNHTMGLRFAAADLVIFLDINRITCLWSAMRRAGKKRADMPDFLTEPSVFSKDSREFYRWIWSYPRVGRKAVLDWHARYPATAFLRVTTRRQMNRLVRQWQAQGKVSRITPQPGILEKLFVTTRGGAVR